MSIWNLLYNSWINIEPPAKKRKRFYSFISWSNAWDHPDRHFSCSFSWLSQTSQKLYKQGLHPPPSWKTRSLLFLYLSISLLQSFLPFKSQKALSAPILVFSSLFDTGSWPLSSHHILSELQLITKYLLEIHTLVINTSMMDPQD